MTYTGYLSSSNGTRASDLRVDPWQDQPYVLVTPGGGRNGEDLVDRLLSAYESHADLPNAALVVFGPFMRALPAQPRPSDAVVPGLLGGLDRIHDLTEEWLDEEFEPRRLALA